MIIQWIYLTILWLHADWITANPIEVKPVIATEFLILHNNDMHARFEQTNVNSESCTPEDAKSNKCFGGFARVAHE